MIAASKTYVRCHNGRLYYTSWALISIRIHLTCAINRIICLTLRRSAIMLLLFNRLYRHFLGSFSPFVYTRNVFLIIMVSISVYICIIVYMIMFSSHLAAPILVCVVFLIYTRECSTSVPALNNPCRLSGVLTFNLIGCIGTFLVHFHHLYIPEMYSS